MKTDFWRVFVEHYFFFPFSINSISCKFPIRTGNCLPLLFYVKRDDWCITQPPFLMDGKSCILYPSVSSDDKHQKLWGNHPRGDSSKGKENLLLNGGLILIECLILDDPQSQQDFQKDYWLSAPMSHTNNL